MIIAKAGKPGAVTIATNMAGRGTDIQLGGNLRHAGAGRELADIEDAAKRTKSAAIRALNRSPNSPKRKLKAIAAGGLHGYWHRAPRKPPHR